MVFTNGLALVDGAFRNVDVRVEGGRIAEVGEALSGEERVDLQGDYLIPGLIDCHTHGHGGVDALQGASAALRMSQAYARHGVTAFLPTTASAEPEGIGQAVRSIAMEAMGREAGARILGVHLEGCFLSEGYRGAHRREDLIPPSIDTLMSMGGGCLEIVRLLTLSPELPGAERLIRYARSRGIVVSAGHTAATYAQMERAAALGMNHATHVYNAMSPLHHREPGAVGAALTLAGIYPELIADGIHVHPAAMGVAVRLAGDRLCLITDSMMAAGMPDGEYTLSGQRVVVQDGTARTESGNLAGSTLTLDAAVRNIVRLVGVSVEEAIAMASKNPARSLGLTDCGEIRVGFRADVCRMDRNLHPRATWIYGKCVYQEERV